MSIALYDENTVAPDSKVWKDWDSLRAESGSLRILRVRNGIASHSGAHAINSNRVPMMNLDTLKLALATDPNNINLRYAAEYRKKHKISLLMLRCGYMEVFGCSLTLKGRGYLPAWAWRLWNHVLCFFVPGHVETVKEFLRPLAERIAIKGGLD